MSYSMLDMTICKEVKGLWYTWLYSYHIHIVTVWLQNDCDWKHYLINLSKAISTVLLCSFLYAYYNCQQWLPLYNIIWLVTEWPNLQQFERDRGQKLQSLTKEENIHDLMVCKLNYWRPSTLPLSLSRHWVQLCRSALSTMLPIDTHSLHLIAYLFYVFVARGT